MARGPQWGSRMKNLALLFSIVAGGCMTGASTGTQQGTIMSCFQSSKTGALDCVDTPQGPETEPTDIDHDGTGDAFECADRDSDDDGTPDFEDHHDDRDGSDDTVSDGKGSGSSSGDHDGDGDGIDDSEDCGNVTTQPPA